MGIQIRNFGLVSTFYNNNICIFDSISELNIETNVETKHSLLECESLIQRQDIDRGHYIMLTRANLPSNINTFTAGMANRVKGGKSRLIITLKQDSFTFKIIISCI